MRQKDNALTIAVCYIGVTLIALNVAIRVPEYFKLIALCYLVAVVVSTISLIVGFNIAAARNSARERKQLSKIKDSINAMVILWDDNFKNIEVNSQFTAITGYTSEDMKDQKNLHNVFPPDAFAPSLQAIVNNRDEEFYVLAKDGSRVCTIWNTSIMSVQTVKRHTSYIMMSIGVDLSENAQMKEELLKYSKDLAASENKLSMSMEISEIGLLLKEPDSYLYFVSDQLRKMLGISSEYVTVNELTNLIHPKDVVAFEALVAAMTESSPEDAEKIHSIELHMLSADASYHWYQFRYKISPNKNILYAQIGGAVIDITKDKEKDYLIEHMAYIDDVTQINNRNKFMMIGQETFECFREAKLDYWVIVLDIDNFHIINDTCGYLNGNKLLSDFAVILMNSLTNGGIGARIGGDNFAIIIRDSDNDTLPVIKIREIQQKLAELSYEKYANQTVTCSAGYCKMSDGGADFAQVLDHAEFSLSTADEIRGSITRYDNKVHDKIIKSNTMEKELTEAVDNQDFVLYYQPKINLADGSLIGMEALIRWIKPDGSVVPPSDFIPVAENSLLITKISEFVLYEACRQNVEWQKKGYEPITVSVNLTAVDFYQTNVTEAIKNALEKTGLEAQYLDVELTESLALKDIQHAIHQMEEIKSLGVKLSMDDFGTGYSSLSYIQVLPITLLKLDRSFVMYLEEDEISREIVSAVIRIAKSKKIETIAEGIETVGQAQILKSSGCDHAQGYFFGKPMPADKFEEFMASKQKQNIQTI